MNTFEEHARRCRDRAADFYEGCTLMIRGDISGPATVVSDGQVDGGRTADFGLLFRGLREIRAF